MKVTNTNTINFESLIFNYSMNTLTNTSILSSFGIEFSGVNASGQKVMGLTMANLYEPISKLDPLLTWRVPENWTLAEAVSVPLIYAHVSVANQNFIL